MLRSLCAATVQQHEQISRKLEKGFLARMRSLAGVSQAPETTSKLSYCSLTAGAAGSIGHRLLMMKMMPLEL